MKTQLLSIIFTTWTTSALAQGTVLFSNYSPNVLLAPVFDFFTGDPCFSQKGRGYNPPLLFFPVGGMDYGFFAPLAGSNHLAQLLSAPGAGVAITNLVLQSTITSFRTGGGSGFFYTTPATLSNVPPDAPVATVMMVAWSNHAGLYPTWTEAEPAWKAGLIPAGSWGPFNVTNIGGSTNGAPIMYGLESFNIYYREFRDIGLRVYDGTGTIKIACEIRGLTSPLRIAKNGTTYGIVLVETNAPDASGIQIGTLGGVKAWKRLP